MMLRLVVPLLLAVAPMAHGQKNPRAGRGEHFRRAQDFEGPAILKKALSASKNLRYVGTRVVEFRRNGNLERHEETITRDRDRVRIEFPEGSPMAGQVIVETGFERRHYFPDKNEIHVLPARREDALGRMARMLSHADRFTFDTAPGQAIAGLRTEQVVVSDKSGNVLQRMYIDPRSGLILKRSLFDPVGTPVGGYEYVRVDLTPNIDSRVFQIRRKGAKVITPAGMLERLAAEHGFLPIVLPPVSGYRLEISMVRNVAGREVLMQFYRSGNGSRLTLNQIKANVDAADIREFATRQRLQAYSWFFRGNTFVLIGNVDPKQLQRIAKPIGG